MKCPKCGAKGTLVLSVMYQVSHDYKIKRDGTLPNKYKKSSEAHEEWSCINCQNCGFNGTDLQGVYSVVDGKVVFEE